MEQIDPSPESRDETVVINDHQEPAPQPTHPTVVKNLGTVCVIDTGARLIVDTSIIVPPLKRRHHR